MKKEYAKIVVTALSILLTSSTVCSATTIPNYVKIVTINEGSSPAKSEIAFNNVYALNEGMFPIYDHSLAMYQEHFLQRHPLIMALFSGKGGRFILYRPGKPPLEADSPPEIYRLGKSVGHCAMATYTLLAPYADTSASDLSWLAELQAYRTRVQTALDSLDGVNVQPKERALMADTLRQILVFHDQCIKHKSFTYDDIETFTHGIKPDLAKLIDVCSAAQVGHWWKVMEDWKKLLGSDWDQTYALSNSIYVARQNNILFTILANFMGEKVMNDRLILLETTDFTTTPDAMLNSFIRIVSDRALGQAFYGNYRLMDYELLGGGGRRAIAAEAGKRGLKPLLPPLVPFNSHEWPMKIDPNSGSGPTLLDNVH